jgi:D-alanyl-D-alanine carboxypeptidase/D-alanyl-D-alanine-endopeptidase (penicillin-binding protein 4)
MRKLFVLIFLFFLTTGYLHAHKIRKRKIKKLFTHSKIANDHFTGFALYDLDRHQMVYEWNAGKYFTPASNTKLLTFYTCLNILGDSIPALKYEERGDSLIFWGTGDPSFLHSDLKGINAYKFLKATAKRLYYATDNYKNNFFGNGWAWDDYNEYYQAEISDLPIEDNVALFYAGENGKLNVKPTFFISSLTCDSNLKTDKFVIRRDFLSNTFKYPAMPVPARYRKEIPWKTSVPTTIALLEDTLKKHIEPVYREASLSVKTIYNQNADTVYKRMLQPSDNFIAEQLLLVCSSVKFNTLDADSVIRYAKIHFLDDLPDAPQWVDGSGLSRRNLITPRSIVYLLRKILTQVKDEQLLHSLLPAGGLTGTLKHAYQTDHGVPFVWAKTGSLENNYNQSGYLITRKGKRLAFSFMNNNFTEPAGDVRDEMVKIITYIHNNY